MDSHKKVERKTNWLAVLLVFATSFIYYFPYDHLQPLMKPIIEEYGLNLTGFNFAYALADIPTLFILLLAPSLIRSFGSSTLLVVSVGCMSLGQLLIAFSSLSKSFVLLLIGRFLLGLLREPFALLIQVLLRRYFSPSHFRYMIALQIAVITKAKIINVYFVPYYLLESESLSNTLFVCWAIAQFSTIAAVVYLLRTDQHDQEEEPELYDDKPVDPKPFDKISFILLLAVHVLQGGCFKAFSNVAVDFLESHYDIGVLDAGCLWSLHYITFAVVCPLLFWLISKQNKAVLGLFPASSGLLVVGLLINIYSTVYFNAGVSVVLYAVFLSARMVTVFPLISEMELPRKIKSNLQFAIGAEAFGFVTVPLFSSLISDVVFDSKYIYDGYLNKLLIVSFITFVLGLVWTYRYHQKQKAHPHPAVHVE